MIQSILECRLTDSAKFKTLDGVDGMLAYFQDSLQIDLLEHCSQKMEQSARDMQQARKMRFDEVSLAFGETERLANSLTPKESYQQDIQKIKNALLKDTLSMNPAKTIVVDLLRKAEKTLNRKRNMDFGDLILLYLGRSQLFVEPYVAANSCYQGIYTYLMNEPMESVTEYQRYVLQTINQFSHKLEADEFWTIYMDMLNNTAADFLGAKIVDMLNTYEMYSFVLDQESIFALYRTMPSEK